MATERTEVALMDMPARTTLTPEHLDEFDRCVVLFTNGHAVRLAKKRMIAPRSVAVGEGGSPSTS
jgi:ribosome biogenesis SPOUT family RNA methylase Rps3